MDSGWSETRAMVVQRNDLRSYAKDQPPMALAATSFQLPVVVTLRYAQYGTAVPEGISGIKEGGDQY